jgi:hypothetical protein
MRLAATHPDGWVLGLEDEVWWSQVSQPSVSAWMPSGRPLRLVEQSVAKDDPNPKVLACYGLLARQAGAGPDQIWLRFVDGRPVSGLTTQFLDWCCARLAARGDPGCDAARGAAATVAPASFAALRAAVGPRRRSRAAGPPHPASPARSAARAVVGLQNLDVGAADAVQLGHG